MVGRARREGRPARRRHPDDARPRRRPRRSEPPDLGHSQVVCVVRGHQGRPAHRRMRRRDERHGRRRGRDPAAELPRHPRPVRNPRLGARPGARSAGQRSADRRGGTGTPDGRRLPIHGRHRPDPRLRADGPPDPRIGRPRDGAGPDPRLGSRVRGDVLARAAKARVTPLRLGADEHHRRRNAQGLARQLRLRRRGHARAPGGHREGRDLGRRAVGSRLGRPCGNRAVRWRRPRRRV